MAAADVVLLRDGPEKLSLRSVAAEAGVAPNAVYTYLDDLADLRNALADRFLGRLDLTVLEGSDPRTCLARFLSHVVGLFDDHPSHAMLLAAGPVSGPHALALNEALLDFFDRAGLEPSAAATATVFATEWVHGAVILAATDDPSPAYLRGLSTLADYPRTQRMLTASVGSSIDLVVRAVLP